MNIREKFFDFLLKKTCTSKQTREYLERNHAQDIDALMNEAEDMGLIDDKAFARLFVEGHRTWGNLKISYELSMKGISRQDISTALDEAEDECERAEELAEGWRASGLEERKIISRLMSRGFSSKSANYAAKRGDSTAY